jgi:sugar/nucleoside kinase (ribokinase family)
MQFGLLTLQLRLQTINSTNTMVTERKYDLIVVGEINPDLILTGEVDPIFGQVEKMVDDAILTIGSSSCIFACAAARLGLRVAFIGKTGGDQFGYFMRDQLASRGVDIHAIVVDPRLKTGLSVILSRGNDRAILTYAGSIPELSYEDIDLSLFPQARHIHLGGFFMLRQLRAHIPELFRYAHSSGATTSIDTNYDPEEQWSGNLHEALAEADVFLPNETELKAIAKENEIGVALAKLAAGGKSVVMKLGAKGGMAMKAGVLVSAPALPVQVVDTTGAGDTFDAGFLYGWLNGWDLAHSLQLACVCGSLSTRASGGTAAQPSLEEALSHLETGESR